MKRMFEVNPELINVQPSGRWSALHQAVHAGNAFVVAFLLSHGANYDAVTADGKKPEANET